MMRTVGISFLACLVFAFTSCATRTEQQSSPPSVWDNVPKPDEATLQSLPASLPLLRPGMTQSNILATLGLAQFTTYNQFMSSGYSSGFASFATEFLTDNPDYDLVVDQTLVDERMVPVLVWIKTPSSPDRLYRDLSTADTRRHRTTRVPTNGWTRIPESAPSASSGNGHP